MAQKMITTKSIAIKICGLTNLEQALEISSLGVNAIGIIGVPNSPRYVKEAERRDILYNLSANRPKLKRVWVISNLKDVELELALKGDGTPTTIQLHGNESPEKCSILRQKYPEIEWWKAIRIRTEKDIQLAQRYENHVDNLLFDAWSNEKIGGTGEQIPLKLIKELNSSAPWWLAGGICAETIKSITNQVIPYGIDSSSKLELVPGIKDIEKVKLLINTIRK